MFGMSGQSCYACSRFSQFVVSFILSCRRVTPPDGDTSPSGELPGATGGAGAMAIPATSTLSLPMSQGKPSLRRIKGRIHRSKSLDSIDLLDSNVRLATDSFTPAKCACYVNSKPHINLHTADRLFITLYELFWIY